MKSAYELALERLERSSGPTRKLTEEQKRAIVEIEKKYAAKIAEKRIEFEGRLARAGPDQADALQKEIAEIITSLETQRDIEKDAIWRAEQG